MRILFQLIAYPVALCLTITAGFLLDNGVARLLPRRPGKIRRFFPPLLFWASIQMPSWIGDENLLFLLPFFLVVFWLCYQARPLARLVLGLCFYALLTPLNMMLDSAGHWGLAWDLDSLEGVAVKVLFYLLIWLLLRRLAKEGRYLELEDRLWYVAGLLVLTPLMGILSFSLWDTAPSQLLDQNRLNLAYTILPFALLSAAALLVAISELSRQEELKKAARLADLRQLYYENLNIKDAQVRALRHDMTNHLAAIMGLLDRGEFEKAVAYLRELSDSPALHGMRRVCENQVANVVFAAKMELMDEAGVAWDIQVSLPPALSISDVDLCALVGNALDNAIAGAAQAADKRILVRMRQDKGLLMLKVENTFGSPPEEKGGRFPTTKKDKEAHGFGLRGMEEIASRYHGTLSAGVEGEMFRLVACLPVISPLPPA